MDGNDFKYSLQVVFLSFGKYTEAFPPKRRWQLTNNINAIRKIPHLFNDFNESIVLVFRSYNSQSNYTKLG